jgi:DNA-binding CsgD family transcriptional regulator
VTDDARPDRHALLELQALLTQIAAPRGEGNADRFTADDRYRCVHRLWIAAGNEALAYTQATRLPALSPQEREIALLAAAGLSNKEIGERLHVSHRTVGAYLYRIFPKLGITSRAALRDALERRTGNEVGSFPLA